VIVVLLTIWFRGLLIVTLTAANVVFVSRRQWWPAFITGYGISLVWWANAHTAALKGDLWPTGATYALGAACGTVTGIKLAAMWNGRKNGGS
jgi:hypothetical protein